VSRPSIPNALRNLRGFRPGTDVTRRKDCRSPGYVVLRASQVTSRISNS
jgi:hypothetical protein